MGNEEQETIQRIAELNTDDIVQETEHVEKDVKEIHHDFEVGEGPFQVHPLIQSLPSELDYTSFEAYDENIYLGTSTGDLLHYFEIEPRNYMLVSQTKFDSDSTHRIDKILLLPRIERALVLSNNTLVVFLLPEFAPAPNTLKLNGICDIVLRCYSDRSNSYKMYAASKDYIKFLKVSSNAITRSKIYDYKNIEKLECHDHILAVAQGNTYEIINLTTSSKTPLFRVSETDAPLAPVIANFSQREYLISTGGASYQDSSMALIVNHHGDIVNGTIVLEKYPQDIIVSFPHIVVNFGGKNVSIYRLGDNPQVVQRITSNGACLQIAQTTKVFDKFKSTEVKKRVVEKLRKVSIIRDSNQTRIDNERDYISQIFVEESSIAIYGKAGIHVLLKVSPVLDFTQFDETNIDEIRRFLLGYKTNYISEFKELEIEYLTTMMLLIVSLHCDSITDEVIKDWCSSLRTTDIRLLFYLLELEIFGDLWVPNGLMLSIQKVKSLKLVNKCDDLMHSLKLIKTFEIPTTDSDNIIKTIDINIFMHQLRENEELIDISYFDERSLVEMTKIAEEQPGEHMNTLLKLYERRGLLLKSLELMKKHGNYSAVLAFLEQKITRLPPSYINECLVDDLMSIINDCTDSTTDIVEKAMDVVSDANINPRKLITKAGDNANVKALIIEKLGAQNPDDKHYLAEHYTVGLQKTMQENNLWDEIAEFMATYSQDMNYTKCCIADFLMIKIKHHEKFRRFFQMFNNLRDLCHINSSHELVESVTSQIKTFDIGHILTLLFLTQIDLLPQFFSKEEILELSLRCNDFISIERCLDQQNIIQVLSHYAELPKKESSAQLMFHLLVRNQKLAEDRGVLLSILNGIPVDHYFDTLFDGIFCIIRKMEGQKRDLELQKALLKDEIHIYTNWLNRFNQDKTL